MRGVYSERRKKLDPRTDVFAMRLDAGASVLACRCDVCGTFRMVSPRPDVVDPCGVCGLVDERSPDEFLALIAEVASMQEAVLEARDAGVFN